MAEANDQTAEQPVAFLDVYYRASVTEEFYNTSSVLDIPPNQGFFFGRSESCEYICQDPTISNKHLHFNCIIYEDGASEHGVPPIVYVQDLSTNGTYLTRARGFKREVKEERMHRRDGKVLLDDGDQLRVSPNLALRFRYAVPVTPDALYLTAGQMQEAQLFADRYTITKQILGSGGHGSVFAALHNKSNRQLACKVVEVLPTRKDGARREDAHASTAKQPSSAILHQKEQREREAVLTSHQFREFDILKDLDHPNIVHLEKVFWSSSTIFIFQELVTSGDLFSYIEYNGGKLSDPESAVILLQILKGVEYMHDRDIVHRDLKPDNILVSTSTDTPLRVVITDFGSCRRVDAAAILGDQRTAKKRMFSVVGTLEYAAPEIYPKYDKQRPIEKGYSKAVDMWSIGAIATALLTGDVIFTDRLDPMMAEDPAKVILKLSSQCDLSILDNNYSAWRTVGNRPKSFIRSLLVIDESRRLTVKQALDHEWFTNKSCEEQFRAIYEKAISSWQPRRKSFRVIEALDRTRMNPSTKFTGVEDQGRSHHFQPLSVPFPQGELYSTSVYPSAQLARQVLPTIGEEVTPEPGTPGEGSLELPTASEDYIDYSEAFDVQQSLSQLDLDADMLPVDVVGEISPADKHHRSESKILATLGARRKARSESLLNSIPELSDEVDSVPQETPRMQRKRRYSDDENLNGIRDNSSMDSRTNAANISKKVKTHR